MVVEPTAVVADGVAQGLVDAIQGGKESLDGLIGDTGLLGGGIKGVGVGGVVLGVVGLHRQRVDVGLEGVIGVGKLDLLEHGEAPNVLGFCSHSSSCGSLAGPPLGLCHLKGSVTPA